MKHTKEEILNALQIIKDECAGSRCEKCPFGDKTIESGTKCKLQRICAVDWKIKKEYEGVWRAFEE